MDTVDLPTRTADAESTADGLTSYDRLLGGLAAGLAALLPIAMSSAANSDSFTPKYGLLLILTAAGLVPLARLATRSRYAWTARAGIAFVAVGFVSAAISPSRLVGFFGLYFWGEGAVFLLALISAWAVGVSLSPETREWLYWGLLVGVGANAVAAVAQTALGLNTATADLSGFGLFNGTQADGMLGNPVHLEAILLGGLALVLGRTCRAEGRGRAALLVFVALLGAALECSSERFAIVLLVVLAAYALYAYRLRAVPYLVALGAGFGAVLLSGTGATLSQRVATSNASTTFTLRIHAWIAGTRATLEHRIALGFGPGEMRNAITLYQTPGFARRLSPGKYFTDMHDLFVNVLVMTGVIGLLLFLGFLYGTCWRVRGAFAGFAAFVLAVELVEPMNVGVTPLAFLALGAALVASRGEALAGLGTRRGAGIGEPTESTARPPQPGRWATALLALLPLIAVVPAAIMVAGDVYDHKALQPFTLSAAQKANTLLPIWPVSAQALAEIYAYESVIDPSERHHYLETSRHWTFIAATRDPSDNELWVNVARADIELGDTSAARGDVRRALADDPLSVDALVTAGTLDCLQRQWSSCTGELERALSVAPDDPTVMLTLGAARNHDLGYFHTSTRTKSGG